MRQRLFLFAVVCMVFICNRVWALELMDDLDQGFTGIKWRTWRNYIENIDFKPAYYMGEDISLHSGRTHETILVDGKKINIREIFYAFKRQLPCEFVGVKIIGFENDAQRILTSIEEGYGPGEYLEDSVREWILSNVGMRYKVVHDRNGETFRIDIVLLTEYGKIPFGYQPGIMEQK